MSNPKIYDTGVVYFCRYNDRVIYVGSCENFDKRMVHHKSDCYNINNTNHNYPIYKYIRDTDDFEKFEFKIEYTYHNITKKELEKHEAKCILEFELDNLFNCYVPGRTKKQYYQDNKEKLNEINKKYQQDNKDKVKLKNIKYYQNNKDKINSKDWYCDVCDNTTKNANKSRHIKTPKHQSNLQSNLLHLSPEIFN